MALLLVMLGACAPQPNPPLTLSGATMGTTWTVKIAVPAEVEVARAELQASIEALLEEVNDEMSTYRPHSELSRFNAAAEGEWIPVSPTTAAVVERAIEIGRQSRGALDVTVGPLVDLWGFGTDPRPARVPSVDELEAARQAVGLEHLEVSFDPPGLRKQVAGLRVDLSAIAKGDGVDRVGALLDAEGYRDWLVEIGGEMRGRGRRPDGEAWSIAIERPSPDSRSIAKIVPLRDLAVATSGDYRNYFVEDGVRYSHTIDPRTGAPIRHELASVTILAETCRDADGWATAIDVLGPEEGYAVAVEQGLAALLLVRDGDGFREVATPRFLALTGDLP